MLHYAVSPDGQVFSYRKQQQARDAAAALTGDRVELVARPESRRSASV